MKSLSTKFELLMQLLIAYSVVTYFIELQLGSEHSRQGPSIFLWSERAVAAIFTVEYFVRWRHAKDHLRYPFTAMAVVDALAILPFYIGFLVDMRALRLVRTLRVLRLFKLYRYNAALQSLTDSFWRVRYHLRVVGVVVLMFVLLSSTAIFECERLAQPTAFAQFTDAIWWCITTLTTVGYGDKFPVTGAGRIVATATVVFGLGVFGTFISLIGGAFVSTLNETSNSDRVIRVSSMTCARLRALLRERGLDDDDAGLERLVDTALEQYGRSRQY